MYAGFELNCPKS